MPSEQMSYNKGFYYHQFQLEAPSNEHSYTGNSPNTAIQATRLINSKLPEQAAQNEFSLKQKAILHMKTA